MITKGIVSIVIMLYTEDTVNSIKNPFLRVSVMLIVLTLIVGLLIL